MTHRAAGDEPDKAPAGGDSSKTRRSFLRSAAMTAGPAVLAAGATATTRAATPTGQPGARVRVPNLFPGQNARNFAEIRTNENAHVAALQQRLGTNSFPAAALQNLAVPANNTLLFVAKSSIFENTDVGAYLATGPLITPANRPLTGGILAVEAYHCGYLNSLINAPLVLNGEPIALPFSLAGVVQNVTPYLVDPTIATQLAGAIGPIPSAENDIAVLRFALLVEYIGSSFYNVNVPRFFPA